jgi:hypothetical protein
VKWFALAAACALFGAVAAIAFAQGIGTDFRGAFPSHDSEESFEMSVGLTPSGRPNRARTIREVRKQVALPSYYGRLVGVTGDAHAAILWYQDDSGHVRNVVVPQPAADLVRVEPTQAVGLEIRHLR